MHFFFQAFVPAFMLPPVAAMKNTPRFVRRPAEEISQEDRFLFSRLSTLNVLLKRRAKIYAQETFGFTLTEWRMTTLLRQHAPISIRELALEALTDAAQISRAAANLAKRGYVTREKSREDSREAQLRLTRRGLAASNEMYGASLLRNDELLSGQSAQEIQAFAATLDRLIARARQLVDADERLYG
jgi:DNA-binding MarR family transcriptional regulator